MYLLFAVVFSLVSARYLLKHLYLHFNLNLFSVSASVCFLLLGFSAGSSAGQLYMSANVVFSIRKCEVLSIVFLFHLYLWFHFFVFVINTCIFHMCTYFHLYFVFSLFHICISLLYFVNLLVFVFVNCISCCQEGDRRRFELKWYLHYYYLLHLYF